MSRNFHLDTVLLVNKALRLNGTFHSSTPALPPTFISTAVRRTYALELEAIVECLGQLEKFEIYWQDHMLLPVRIQLGVKEAMRSVAAGTSE
jgi:hypothetical protein